MDSLVFGLLELVFVLVGKLVVPVFTLGRWRGERLNSNEYSIHSAAGALSFDHKGEGVISRHGLLFIGIFSVVVMIVAALVLTTGIP